MSRVKALSLVVWLGACTTHTPGNEKTDNGLLTKLRGDFALLSMSREDRQAFEDRAKLRERQRQQGLRVCEEGEHGTKWREDCKMCQCEHGVRICPAVKCTHNAQIRENPPFDGPDEEIVLRWSTQRSGIIAQNRAERSYKLKVEFVSSSDPACRIMAVERFLGPGQSATFEPTHDQCAVNRAKVAISDGQGTVVETAMVESSGSR